MHSNNRDDKDYRMSTEETKEGNDRGDENSATKNRFAPRFLNRTSGRDIKEEVKVMNDFELESNDLDPGPNRPSLEFGDRKIIDFERGGILGIASSLNESKIYVDSHESKRTSSEHVFIQVK